jgi:hypothetical protein
LQVACASDKYVGNALISPDLLPQALNKLNIRNICDTYASAEFLEHLGRIFAAIDNNNFCAASNKFINARKSDSARTAGNDGQKSVQIQVVTHIPISVLVGDVDDCPITENRYAKINAIGVEIRVE